MSINRDYVKGFVALGVLAAAIAGFMAYPGSTGDEPNEIANTINAAKGEAEIASTEGDEPKAEKAMANTGKNVKEKANAQTPTDNDSPSTDGEEVDVKGEELVVTVTKESE